MTTIRPLIDCKLQEAPRFQGVCLASWLSEVARDYVLQGQEMLVVGRQLTCTIIHCSAFRAGGNTECCHTISTTQ